VLSDVADLDVAPDQESEQLSIEIYFFEINGLPTFSGPEGEFKRGGHFSP